MVNTPIPHSLKSEAKKAAKILRDFTMPSAKTGPDKIIPADFIANAAGLAVLSVFKIGFLVAARGGSGIVIAKLDDGSWSAPSAIGIAGLGGGFEIGAEVTDFVIILNKRAAVDAFSKGGNLTLGGNFTIAAGPLGRNMEGDIAIRSPAAIYTYSKTKGLFAGVSVEGSYLIERKDANKKFYKEEVRAFDILQGEVQQPPECFELYEVLSKHHVMYERAQDAVLKKEARTEAEKASEEEAQWASEQRDGSKGRERPKFRSRVRSIKMKSKSKSKDGKSKTVRTSSTTVHETTYTGLSRGRSHSKTSDTYEDLGATGGANKGDVDDWEAAAKAKAVWGFDGQMPCDLTFHPGDEITILTRTDTQQDWWEGSLNGRIGIFPANYVEVVG